jgi:hypothetical protein
MWGVFQRARLIQSDTAVNSAKCARDFVKRQPNWLRHPVFLLFCAIRTSHVKERKCYVLVTYKTGTIFQTVPNNSYFWEAALSGDITYPGSQRIV